MSFQGDVAGIGLGELLQGLARGGRDGVLTLYGHEVSAAIGLKKSRIYIVASQDETTEQWRDRTQRAWAKDGDPAKETQRREVIARVARLELLYQMLEADNLHFRFEPGPLPTNSRSEVPKGDGEVSLGGDSVSPSDDEMEKSWGRAFTVEFLLLEHARITDESRGGPAGSLRALDVPRVLSYSEEPKARKFLDECDGNSTLLEIADRLGWTLTQCRHSIGQFMAAGSLRIAHPRELLASAQRELENKQYSRAADRIEGWILSSRPGPAPVEEANLLIGEWEGNRLSQVLRRLSASCGRTMLRKLDHVDLNVRAGRDRWIALQEIHRGDPIITLHTAITRFSVEGEPDARAFQELLQVARTFQQREQPGRAGALLRLASSHMPSRLQTRIELGKRMLESDLVEEGSRWLLETARELMAQGEPDKALVPLRAVLRVMPDDNSSNGLLIQARAMMAKRKRRRWQSACLGATALILASAGVVRVHSDYQTRKTLESIEANLSQPTIALQMLEAEFPGSNAAEISELRGRIYQMRQEELRRGYSEWADWYDAAFDAIMNGDPIEGLELTLDLPEAPDYDPATSQSRNYADLFGAITKRIVDQSVQLDLPVDASERELAQEQRLLLVVVNAIARMTPEHTSRPEIDFLRSAEGLRDTIETRAADRQIARSKELERMRQKDQNTLLETARSHRTAGNLSLAIEAWDMLFARERVLRELKTLGDEYSALVQEKEAIETATDLAAAGRHSEAHEALKLAPGTLGTQLPWRVDSRPANARVTLASGEARTTPFVMKSAFGEPMELTFTSEGCVPRLVRLSAPGDIAVNLYRVPERAWGEARVVDASPVAVAEDHILCDRGGRVVRIGKDGTLVWELQLKTLGGIKRTPVFLPGRAGHLVVLSEDGTVWFLDAHTGKAGRQYEVGSPPTSGPELTRGGITATFENGRVARWGTDLEPTFYPVEGLVTAPDGEADDGIEVASTSVRISRGANTSRMLTSPWTKWSVEVLDDEYLVRTDDGRGFSARRSGEWRFVFWEQPKALVPNGRLWVSDGDGIRSFLPDESILTILGQDIDPSQGEASRQEYRLTDPRPSQVGRRNGKAESALSSKPVGGSYDAGK